MSGVANRGRGTGCVRLVGHAGARRAFATLWCALLVAACCWVAPGIAHAYYNEFDTKNSAQQDMGQLGERIPASAIPAGTYGIDANSSSRMCVIYGSAQDAAELANKWHATLVSEGGQLAVTFFLSKSYTDIYLGTAQEAASLSDSSGTDNSRYIQGDPYQVTTADGVRNVFQYTLSIPSLNTPVTMATFDGGGADGIHLNVAGAKWFDRQVAFIPSQELLDVLSGKGGSRVEQDARGDVSGAPAAELGQPARAEAQAARPGSTAAQEADAATESDAADGQAGAGVAAAGGRRGALLVPATAWAAGGLDGADVSAQAVVGEQDEGLLPAQVLGIAACVALAVGVALRVVLFAASKKT